jgi:hypothetical protein
MATTQTPYARLLLGDLNLWAPPFVLSELIGTRSTYTSGECAKKLESTDLTYDIFLTGACELATLQIIQQQIEQTLDLAPNLTLIRQDTPDALEFRNRVKHGEIDLSNDKDRLRARFAMERTLALVLTLTILPNGAGDGDAAFRHLKYLAATGAFNWTTNTIGALLIDETSTVPDELYVPRLDGFVELGEVVGGGYARQTIAGKSVLEGSQVQLLGDDPEFTTAGGAIGMVLFQDNGSDATSVPLFLISFPELASGLQIVHFDLLGLF